MNRLISILSTLVLLGSSGVIVFAATPNDRCIDSITLVTGEQINGDNSEANYDFNNQGVCGARSDRRSVWYEINGVGKEVTINVCTNNNKLTDFGVFRACNTQNCKGFPPQQKVVTACGEDEANEYSFLAKNGESYYVHVRSDVVFEGGGSNFTIWYTEPTDEPTQTPITEQPTVQQPTVLVPSTSDCPKVFYHNIAISSMISGLGYAFVSLL
mmetsp:Transcript_20516/g.44646  ORF Transcript_20516/g.44646 Transcript_20516/m.44646 type:complete len:213 (+) Transcript_20516:128-766(+)